LETAVAKKYRLTGGRKAFNAILTALIQLGIPTGSIVLLTVAGRRTGQPRSTPVTLLTASGRRYLASPYGEVAWVQNVRASGRADLKYRGRVETVAPLLKTYREKYAVVAPFFDPKPGDPVERFAAEADKHPVLRFCLPNPSGALRSVR
jgi:deazaflavin-dependent oxidoreductase (nitroreductase family)